MVTGRRIFAMAVGVLLVVTVCAQAEEPAAAKRPGATAARAGAEDPLTAPMPRVTAADGSYKIGPEDLLDIAVWNNTAISRAVPVRPDGKISLPLLNDVQAAGLTPMQLRDVLEKKLA